MSLKDLSGRWPRWFLQLQTYDFSIERRKGSENVVADIFSRMSINSEIMIEEIRCFGFRNHSIRWWGIFRIKRYHNSEAFRRSRRKLTT